MLSLHRSCWSCAATPPYRHAHPTLMVLNLLACVHAVTQFPNSVMPLSSQQILCLCRIVTIVLLKYWVMHQPLVSEQCRLVITAAPQVALEVPGWFRAIPLGALERTGCSVMQRVLDRMVPRFLAQLQQDYALWASGDESRKPIGAGEL